MAMREHGLFLLFLALGLLLVACGPGAEATCLPGGTGSKDDAVSAQYFRSMELVNEATGLPGEPDAEGIPQFSSADGLAVQTEAVAEVSARFCIQEGGGPGSRVAFDQTYPLSPGSDKVSLGSFQPGGYIVRVLVGDILVNNFQFRLR